MRPDHRRQHESGQPATVCQPDARCRDGRGGGPEGSGVVRAELRSRRARRAGAPCPFAQSIMTNVGAADLVRRVQSLTRGTARNPPTDVEGQPHCPSFELHHIAPPSTCWSKSARRVASATHRPAVLRACIKALQLCGGTDGLSFHDAAIRMREQNRLVGQASAEARRRQHAAAEGA